MVEVAVAEVRVQRRLGTESVICGKFVKCLKIFNPHLCVSTAMLKSRGRVVVRDHEIKWPKFNPYSE